MPIVAVLDVLLWMIIHPWAGLPLVILGRAVYAHFKPYKRCWWCRNKSGGRPRCWRCKGTRLTRRLGAYHAHKVKLSLMQAWAERGAGE